MSNDAAPLYAMFRFADCEPVGSRAPHFLESCFLCAKPLSRSSDIFMYRGDAPFCSTECREEQIEIDESNERSWRKTYAGSGARPSLRGGEANVPVNKVQVRVA